MNIAAKKDLINLLSRIIAESVSKLTFNWFIFALDQNCRGL